MTATELFLAELDQLADGEAHNVAIVVPFYVIAGGLRRDLSTVDGVRWVRAWTFEYKRLLVTLHSGFLQENLRGVRWHTILVGLTGRQRDYSLMEVELLCPGTTLKAVNLD